MRARRAEDGESSEAEDEEEVWGGSGEEVRHSLLTLIIHGIQLVPKQPDDDQRELMQRTAHHILSSPNPAQLEMRILANHGGDKRFAFLRGRWSHAWLVLKGQAKREKEGLTKKQQERESGLGGLADYGDSEDEGEDGGGEVAEVVSSGSKLDHKLVPESLDPKAQDGRSGDAAKSARRARAKEWAEKRRALKTGAK